MLDFYFVALRSRFLKWDSKTGTKDELAITSRAMRILSTKLKKILESQHTVLYRVMAVVLYSYCCWYMRGTLWKWFVHVCGEARVWRKRKGWVCTEEQCLQKPEAGGPLKISGSGVLGSSELSGMDAEGWTLNHLWRLSHLSRIPSQPPFKMQAVEIT